ncbi:sigma-70 family RNA polymerase sigma factor [Microvirga pudoricolor]|uniref:sigma-70 family RNA polymerase sigma factor n=1 Tax=Microvirga pudoricolor TaxID=2778729 RepID=UPI00194FED12|nr:sigma-70 family RNA polymerase sigma factor [Microvirga pudoricolor]MBM6595611.1 sigma-70 family RNA polymerase sigma factor [Microvirga pudoricolor]
MDANPHAQSGGAPVIEPLVDARYGALVPPQDDIREQFVAAIPSLRAFAISLTGNVDRADDLVQEALLRGLDNIDRFTPGTSLTAWLFTILRNQFYTHYRKLKREVPDPDGHIAGAQATMPDQESPLYLHDVWKALHKLPPEQREALLLTAAEGLGYKEAAEICGIEIGTIKSRINRARSKLAEILGHE